MVWKTRLSPLKLKIHSIKPQTKRKNRFNIKLESGHVFSISEDVFLSKSLVAGQILEKEEIQEIESLEIKNQIKNIVLNLISYRDRSSAEILQRLRKKGFNDKDIKQILDEFESKGFINDIEFAEKYAVHLIEKKLMGKIAVKSKFYSHQISDKDLEPILEKLYKINPPKDLLMKLMIKRVKVRNKSKKDKKRLVSLFKRKGYTWDDIQSFMNNINWEE